MIKLTIRLSAVSLLLLATACAEVEHKYETRTPLTHLSLSPSTANLRIEADDLQRGVSAIDAPVRQIAHSFNAKGSGRLHMVVSAPSAEMGSQQARMLRMALADAGISPDRVTITNVSVQPYGAVATYRQLDVVLPNCPDVPLKASPLGCGLDRQLGRMVARPADLAGNDRIAANPSDPTGLATQRYRTNQPPPIIPSGLVETTDVGQ